MSSVKVWSGETNSEPQDQRTIIDYDIKDENGNVLGGKKAAIQFAYNKLAQSGDPEHGDLGDRRPGQPGPRR